jgi:hypothetical protein
MRAVAALVVIGASAVVLVGCSLQGGGDDVLQLGAGEATLPACPTNSPEPIPVETLDTAQKPSCEPTDRALLFSDGERLQLAKEVGQSSGQADATGDSWYTYQSVGNWGLVAARASSDCSRIEEWGGREAIRRVHEAFGPKWACPSDD